MSKTSEYVTLGHPDKVADYISEYCLDRIIEQDPNVRYAVEVQIKDNIVTYGGEVTTSASLFFDKWIKEAVAEIGYTHEYAQRWDGQTLDASKLKINGHISTQSPDIEQGVDAGGWGDQGIFFGFHCGDTYTGDGWDYFLAKKLGQRLYYLAKDTNFNFGLDIKTQVTVSERHSRPVVEKVIIAIPMINDCDEEKNDLAEYVDQFIDENAAIKSENFELVINGTGRYFTHASVGDCGTTGRKLVVDFYGGNSRIGGGCVDAETEYLSENGWKKISEYDGGMVGQLTDKLELEMVMPERYIDTYHDDVYEISKDKTTNMVLSGNHNVLYRTSKGNLNKKSLSQILTESNQTKKGSHINIPMTFTFDFMNGNICKYNDDWAKIVVAHCADGTILKDGSKKWNCRIRVKKQSKIDRLKNLFLNYPELYEERKYSDGYTYFYYHLEDTSKLLSEQFKNPNYKTAKILAEEIYKWDGSEKYKEYRTTKKEDADFVQFVISGITGKAHSICIHKKKDGYNEVYVVRETNKTHSNPFRKIGKNKIVKKEPQKMYCFTVPSGKLLLRRNNYIFCTANSPWTKDGTKADLALNIFAKDLARDYYIRNQNNVNIEHVETELSCEIGGTSVLAVIKAFDFNGNKIDQFEKKAEVTPEMLIPKYRLNKPIYSEMCERGLFQPTLFF